MTRIACAVLALVMLVASAIAQAPPRDFYQPMIPGGLDPIIPGGIGGPMIPGGGPASPPAVCGNDLDFSQSCNSQYISVMGIM